MLHFFPSRPKDFRWFHIEKRLHYNPRQAKTVATNRQVTFWSSSLSRFKSGNVIQEVYKQTERLLNWSFRYINRRQCLHWRHFGDFRKVVKLGYDISPELIYAALNVFLLSANQKECFRWQHNLERQTARCSRRTFMSKSSSILVD